MARPPDPFRTLEVPRGATLDEVKASYRRLAKLYHPDSAGEKALPRFLAIQAAYESLTEGPARLRLGTVPRGSRTSTTTGSRAAGTSGRATASGSRSTGSAQRSTTGAGRSSTSGTATGRTGQTGRSSAGSATGSANGSKASAGSTAGRKPRRDRRKPTSTSYDGADLEPFEPEWEGASWYGGSSGTYWTLNPKEFADPRKHGPEYQARGRREAAKAEQAARAAMAAAATAAGADPAMGPRRAATEAAAADDSDGRATAQARARDVPPEAQPAASAADGAGDPAMAPPAAATSPRGSGESVTPRAERSAAPPLDTTPTEDLPRDGDPIPAAAGFRASAARFVRGLTGTARRGT
jgi:curved DNA-binding protein CbpA